MNFYDEFFGLVRTLQGTGIRYALIGGLSMAFHDRPRFTRDIDFLVHPEDLARMREALACAGYAQTAPAWALGGSKMDLHRFLKPGHDDEMVVDILVADESSVDIVSEPVLAPSEAGPVPVARREDIIRLKKRRNSKQDQADIEALGHD